MSSETTIPPRVKKRMQEIEESFTALQAARSLALSQAAEANAEVSRIDQAIDIIETERGVHELWIQASNGPAEPKPRVRVEEDALAVLRREGAMLEATLVAFLEKDPEAVHGWVLRALRDKKITKSRDGMLAVSEAEEVEP
jgi:hypothetical protein